jgi:hypothetical protein
MKGIRLVLCFLAAGARADGPGAPPLIIRPDADGVLDVAAAVQARSYDAIPNPFRIRYRPVPPIREVPLVITAVLIPARIEDASVVINGHLYSPGDTIEGLKLSAITADSLELRGDELVLRVPVLDQAPKLRLSR